jgi:hypothetical protein
MEMTFEDWCKVKADKCSQWIRENQKEPPSIGNRMEIDAWIVQRTRYEEARDLFKSYRLGRGKP